MEPWIFAPYRCKSHKFHDSQWSSKLIHTFTSAILCRLGNWGNNFKLAAILFFLTPSPPPGRPPDDPLTLIPGGKLSRCRDDGNKYKKIMREMRENAEIIMRSFSKAKKFRKIWTEKEDWALAWRNFLSIEVIGQCITYCLSHFLFTHTHFLHLSHNSTHMWFDVAYIPQAYNIMPCHTN